MAVCFTIDTPGGSEQIYDRVIEVVTGSGPFPPEGSIFHAAGPTETGWRVVDVWDSHEAFDRFMRERLGPALQQAAAPRPEVTEFPVHNAFSGAAGGGA